MPDPKKQTLSATESAGLFGVSPYVTRWMLYKKFADNIDIEKPQDERMSWGKKLQPLLLAQISEEQKLEVVPNDKDHYIRSGMLGCTRDAEIIAPDLGPGALEAKCVFDYGVWMRDWNGGKAVPKHYEIQNQQQMLVGDGKKSFKWGMIAVWVCGEVKYFRREPIPALWEKLNAEAGLFFADVADKNEPKPFGDPPEVEWLNKLIETDPLKILDRTEDFDLLNLAGMMADAADKESFNRKVKNEARRKLLIAAGDAGKILLPEKAEVTISVRNVAEHTRKASVQKTVKFYKAGDDGNDGNDEED